MSKAVPSVTLAGLLGSSNACKSRGSGVILSWKFWKPSKHTLLPICCFPRWHFLFHHEKMGKKKEITGLSEVLQVTKTWFRMQIWVYREESIQAGWIISTLVKSETTSSNCLLLQPCPLLHSKCASVSVHCVPQRGWGLPAACQLRATTCEQADKAGTQTHRRPFLFFQ